MGDLRLLKVVMILAILASAFADLSLDEIRNESSNIDRLMSSLALCFTSGMVSRPNHAIVGGNASDVVANDTAGGGTVAGTGTDGPASHCSTSSPR